MPDVPAQLKAVESACHRLLQKPSEEGARAELLKAIAAYNGLPPARFPRSVRRLVEQSRDQADSLGVHILETNTIAGPSIEEELRQVCHTMAAVAAAFDGS